MEILEGQGIDSIAVCAAVQSAAQQQVGKLLSEAVQEDQRCMFSLGCIGVEFSVLDTKRCQMEQLLSATCDTSCITTAKTPMPYMIISQGLNA